VSSRSEAFTPRRSFSWSTGVAPEEAINERQETRAARQQDRRDGAPVEIGSRHVGRDGPVSRVCADTEGKSDLATRTHCDVAQRWAGWPSPFAQQCRVKQMRLKTGAVQCGNDWPGVFVRGEETNALALSLSHVLGLLSDSNDDHSIVKVAAQLSELIELLRRYCHAINHVVDQRVALCSSNSMVPCASWCTCTR